jgi:hypothetical protein
MTDDLVKRLRSAETGPHAQCLMEEAADALERLSQQTEPDVVLTVERGKPMHFECVRAVWGYGQYDLYAAPPATQQQAEPVAWLDPSDEDADSCIVLDRIRKHGIAAGYNWWKRYSVPLVYAAHPADDDGKLRRELQHYKNCLGVAADQVNEAVRLLETSKTVLTIALMLAKDAAKHLPASAPIDMEEAKVKLGLVMLHSDAIDAYLAKKC